MNEGPDQADAAARLRWAAAAAKSRAVANHGARAPSRVDANERHPAPRLVIVSGCSGGGKSTLVAALADRGFATVAEPGRRIVAQQRAVGGCALPWIDAAGFARRLVEVARTDLEAARSLSGVVIFDRGLIDAAAALAHIAGLPVEGTLRAEERFHPLVFLTPPWPEIYAEDSERRHGFPEAKAEYERLVALYPRLGYSPVIVPKTTVDARVAFMLAVLANSQNAPKTRRASGLRQTPSERQ